MKFYLYCLFISILLTTHYPPMYAGNPDSWPRLHTSALNKSHRDSYFQILKLDPGTGTGTGTGTSAGGGGEFLLSSCFLVLVPILTPHLTITTVLYCTVLYYTVLYCTVSPGPHPHSSPHNYNRTQAPVFSFHIVL